MKTVIFLLLFPWIVSGYTAISTHYFLNKMKRLYDGEVQWWKNHYYELADENERLHKELHNFGEEWKSEQ